MAEAQENELGDKPSRGRAIHAVCFVTVDAGFRAWPRRSEVFVALPLAISGTFAVGAWFWLFLSSAVFRFHGFIVAVFASIAAVMATLLIQIFLIVPMLRIQMSQTTFARVVRLGFEGVEQSRGASSIHMAWAGIRAIADAPGATLLETAEGDGWPIADAELPSGADRAELRQRLALWRETSA